MGIRTICGVRQKVLWPVLRISSLQYKDEKRTFPGNDTIQGCPKLTDIFKLVSRAVAVDMRIGCILDGAVVYYDNGETVPCGPHRVKGGEPLRFGM
jgi:hypothetical protein